MGMHEGASVKLHGNEYSSCYPLAPCIRNIGYGGTFSVCMWPTKAVGLYIL